MKLIKNLVVLLLVLAVFIYGLLFSLYNEQDVVLDFLFVDGVSLPLSLWSGILVVVGVALGLLVASASRIFQGAELRRVRRELTQAKDKLEKLNH